MGSMMMGGVTAVIAENDTSKESGLEEVVVTAQKREQNLQETPLAISTFDAQALEDQGISDIEDISIYVPNVQISETPGGSTGATIGIRGSVTINPAITWEPTVGIYIDGVFIAKNIGGLFDVAEIERLEILRGPQGTLYGKNTIGGAVNLVTRKPSGQGGGKVRLGAGNYDYKDLFITLDSDSYLDDRLRFNVAFNKKERDGFYENAAGDVIGNNAADDFKELDSVAGRIAVLYDMTDDMQLYYTFDRSKKDNTPAYGQATGTSDDFKRQDKGNLDGSEYDESESLGHSLQIEWQLSETLMLKSISAYREMLFDDNNDYDGTAFTFFHTERHVEQDQWSQEFQLIGNAGDVDFVTGVFFLKEDAEAENPFEVYVDPNTPADVSDDFIATIRNSYGVEATSIAIYSHADWHITEALTLSGGVRWTQEDKDFHVEHPDSVDTATFQPDFPDVEVDDTWTNTSPMIAVSYIWDESVTTYAKISEGWKAGGFNGEPQTSTIAQTPYDEEKVVAYEIGMKSRWWDNRFQANIAVFQNEIDDLQISSFLLPYSQLTNAGEATVKGYEVELLVALTEDLTINANYGYLDAEYDEFIYFDALGTGQNIDIANTALFQYAPEDKFSVGAEYVKTIGVGLFSARVDWSYVGGFDVYPEPWNAASTHVNGYHLLNARISLGDMDLGSDGKTVDVALWGKNITDEEYRINGIPTQTGAINYFGDPRTYGLDVTFNF
ncbi:hypothetical protein A9Q81_07205 [Gammaproteobacteria bacterium 42_54_T18]|nr:hypothetical protein A9Q81_07205 [Gammaproteobacteria bacterium 42_54_T18]